MVRSLRDPRAAGWSRSTTRTVPAPSAPRDHQQRPKRLRGITTTKFRHARAGKQARVGNHPAKLRSCIEATSVVAESKQTRVQAPLTPPPRILLWSLPPTHQKPYTHGSRPCRDYRPSPRHRHQRLTRRAAGYGGVLELFGSHPRRLWVSDGRGRGASCPASEACSPNQGPPTAPNPPGTTDSGQNVYAE